jgi:hypothetical protein
MNRKPPLILGVTHKRHSRQYNAQKYPLFHPGLLTCFPLIARRLFAVETRLCGALFLYCNPGAQYRQLPVPGNSKQRQGTSKNFGFQGSAG